MWEFVSGGLAGSNHDLRESTVGFKAFGSIGCRALGYRGLGFRGSGFRALFRVYLGFRGLGVYLGV